MKKPKKTITEHEEQVAVVSWAESASVVCHELALLFAVPNAGNRHIRYAMKMRAEGLQSGVPDLFLPVARQGSHGLFIEMKRKGATPGLNGKLSEAQKAWIEALRGQGYRVEMCIGAEEAIAVLKDYCSLGWMENGGAA